MGKSSFLYLLKLTNTRLDDGIILDGRYTLAAGEDVLRGEAVGMQLVALAEEGRRARNEIGGCPRSRQNLVARKLQTTLSAEEKLSKNRREKAG